MTKSLVLTSYYPYKLKCIDKHSCRTNKKTTHDPLLMGTILDRRVKGLVPLLTLKNVPYPKTLSVTCD